jgi:UDP-N-acetylglucosamine diphosphorylase/glucosamine-1-phosphate N-acetyltransferase
MNDFILFDLNTNRQNLLPFTFTRPVSEIRCGILTIKEKWEKFLNGSASYLTENYLSELFPIKTNAKNLIINSSLLPSKGIVEAIENLQINQCLMIDSIFLAAKVSKENIDTIKSENFSKLESVNFNENTDFIDQNWQIFKLNGQEIVNDFALLTSGRESQKISSTNTIIGSNPVFLEKGAQAEAAIFNTTKGPIYLGKDSVVMENSVVQGPFALGEHATVKIAAKIYPETTLGPHCKVGGEVSNTVFFSYSNKGHDGFVGNSVIGEWCNIGADTNSSNLKNNYEFVKVWNYVKEGFVSSNSQFCGLLMGDHSKCGINTMFNTGTTIGVSANIFGSGFPRTFIPSFSWGGANGFTTYKLEKAFRTAELMMSRRGIELTDSDKKMLTEVFNITEKYRR